eukprot:CAMPEP_0174831556 /NCGR_PEP_ID=MMETSP1114-20130205/3153_1 /TAXON_ID=312471 /ORGANISM="Neobodo designis, Strain CCAP 1951/1" /LENGTH=272 /DNA_ID=CAMNT_0016065383 /DNA_START=137 /DNA_END=955 /DNA_ORIENTATION=+
MGCGSSSDTVRQRPQQQQQQRGYPQPTPQPQPAPQYPQAIVVPPPTNPNQPPPVYNGYGGGAQPPPVYPAPAAPTPQRHQQPTDPNRGFRGHGSVPTDADGWERYDPGAFGGGQGGGQGVGYSSHNNGLAANEDEALAQAIARSLASAEEERRALQRAGGATRPVSPPPALPGRQMSAQVAFLTGPDEPFCEADLQLMPRVAWCAGQAEDEEARTCALCFEEYADDPSRNMMLLPCFHRFHWDCASDWLKRKPLCPVCKSNAKHTGGSTLLS